MKNLIRMDFYRLFRSRSIKVGMIASAAVAVLGMLCNLGIVAIVKVALDVDPVTADGLALLIDCANWVYGVDFADVMFSGTGWFSLFIGCMVVSAFIGSEQSSGYVKNVIGQLPDRGQMVVSKFVATSFIHFLTLVIYAAVSCACAFLFFGSYINEWSIGKLLLGLGLRLLLYIAVNAVIVFLCMLTKSSSLAMVIGAIFGIGITKFVYMILNWALSVVKIDIDLALFTPDGINGMLSVDGLETIWVRALIVFAAFTVVFVGAAIALVRKRDVR